MRRIDPAYPDLLPVTHVLRPGYLPGERLSLDPVRMGVVWPDAPRRILPAKGAVPRSPVRLLAFARVAVRRPGVLEEALEAGSAVLLVLDDPEIGPADLGLGDAGGRVVAALPVLPPPLDGPVRLPEAWTDRPWGAIVGLFPFPGAEAALERAVTVLAGAGARFAVAAPLLLTPRDRHRILDGCDGSGEVDRIENCLFHADTSRGLLALERRVGTVARALGLEPAISCLVPAGADPVAVRTAALLRVWARRLDQSYEESSWGWRLRRAARAVEALRHDPMELAAEDNLRIVPGFDPWVESFTRAIWHGGEPLESAWTRWTAGRDGAAEGAS